MGSAGGCFDKRRHSIASASYWLLTITVFEPASGNSTSKKLDMLCGLALAGVLNFLTRANVNRSQCIMCRWYYV